MRVKGPPLKGKRFATDVDVEQALTSSPRTLNTAVSYALLEALMPRWDIWLNVTGDYVLQRVPSATHMTCVGHD
jgi:hypothetical protein